MIKSSQAAIDLIITEEVSSKTTYERKYQHPEWPGGASGVTIGIGYDCGYSTKDQIFGDWNGRIPDRMVVALQKTSGITGPPAKSYAASLNGVVTVPWDAAMAAFIGRDMAKWEGILVRALPNTQLLPDDSFGALVSLAYNRGASFDKIGDRYIEMRAIKLDMGQRNFKAIPDHLRAMKRLWPNVAGLRARRDEEAALFEKGISAA